MSLIFLSLTLGFTAHQLTGSEILRDWERRHFPSERVWEGSLTPLNFQRLRPNGKEQQKLYRAVRYLPASTDSNGAIWRSADSRWLAVFTSPDRLAAVFCLECKAPPQKQGEWQFAGQGWAGFEKVIAELELVKPKTPERAVRRPLYADPREIRY